MLKVKRVVFMVLIVSFISVFSAAALALTARDEKLIDICKRYEEWFASHARSYGKTMPFGAGHLEFTCYRVPQTQEEIFSSLSNSSDTIAETKLIAEIKNSGWANNNTLYMSLNIAPDAGSLSFRAENLIDGHTWGTIRYPNDNTYSSAKYVKAEVSESSPNAGTLRQIGGSLWNFGSWVTDVDDGAFVVIKCLGGFSDGEVVTFFKTDCTECANIMAKFLNDISQVMASE